jgi:ABC-type transport system substrate-binding protein
MAVPTGGNVIKPVELMQAVAGYWNAIGVKTNVQTLEFGTYAQQKFDYKIAPLFVWNWFGFDADQMLWGNAYSKLSRPGSFSLAGAKRSTS